jgi:cytoskeletal protein CcmA (bactofilin family)
MFMLENFRKKDVSRPGYTPSPNPYGRVQEALSPAPPPPETPKPELPKAEWPKPELPRAEMPKAESPRTDTAQSVKPAAEESVSKLIVGPDIKLKGAEITDCDTLVVEGRVEAAMESRVLQIAEIGVFEGKAAVEMAEIRGRFDGELTVRKQLVIRATGHVSGKIRYGKLSIEEGGELSGDIGAIGPAPASPDNRPAFVAKASTPPH